ncbi:MAG: hypothetical protein ACLFTA_03715, partial [Candidatus Nanohaloarchaea archaeon]
SKVSYLFKRRVNYMEKIMYLIVAAAVTVFAAGTVLYMSTDTTGSVLGFTDSASDVECENQANNWEQGDPIDQECIEHLPEDKQDEAFAEKIEPAIT